MLEKASNIRQLFCRCLQLSSQLQWNQSIGNSIVSPQGTNYVSETKILGFFFTTVTELLTSVCLEINKYHSRISTTFYSLQVITSVSFSHLKSLSIIVKSLSFTCSQCGQTVTTKRAYPTHWGHKLSCFLWAVKSISLAEIALASPKAVITYPSLAASLKAAN